MIKIYLISFLSALGGTALLMPFCIRLSKHFGVLDHPERRKVHSVPTPRWGGLGIFGGVLFAMIVLLWFVPRFDVLLSFRHKIMEGGQVVGLLGLRQQFVGIMVASLVMLIVGLLDDRHPIPALPKLLVQIIAAYVAMIYGVRMAGISIPGWGFVNLPLILSQILTLLWLLGFMNTVNLADGLDGLAAGLVAIVSATFLIVCVLQGKTDVLLYAKQLKLAAVFSAAVCGAALGFLIYNFHPAKIFMGDGGALFLGFMLGAISIIGTLKTSAVISLLIPVVVIALPVLDVMVAMIRRFRRGKGLMQADRGHFHHKLLALGWTQREVVLLMYVLTLVLSIVTILLTVYKGRV